MSVMSDRWIKEQSESHAMIHPFVSEKVYENSLSYGLSSYGYDVRVGNKFKVFTNVNSAIIDPKQFTDDIFVDKDTDVLILPPNSFALAHTIEYFKIPRNIMVVCVGKSTYARCGIITNVTPLEPEWEGHVTIEISNTTTLPVKIYSNEGIVQCIFMKGEDLCEKSYLDSKGKYLKQTGITLPRVHKKMKATQDA